MTMELSEQKKKELEEIVDKMNREAEMAIYYQEGTAEHEEHRKMLLAYKERVEKMDEHERTFVEAGLLDRKDIHDFYWPELDSQGQHQREKKARLDSEGRTSSDENYRIDGVR
ncbi:MAG: hypothetical protein MUE65_06900 [Methanomassiliicoccales archaeon]|jgi:hypothetical protein|nr:hypothetical protein [Methanomassiliicoccales archaeon]